MTELAEMDDLDRIYLDDRRAMDVDPNEVHEQMTQQARRREETGQDWADVSGLKVTPLDLPPDDPGQETPPKERGFLDQAGEAIKDVARPITDNPASRVLVGGVFDAVNGLIDTADEIGQLASQKETVSYWGGGKVTQRSEYTKLRLPKIPEGDGMAEQFLRDITQFVAGFGPAGKALQATGKAQNILAGAVADITYDPVEGNLSTFLREVNFDNALTQVLDSKVEMDAEVEKRLRGRLTNAFEGGLTGGVVDTAVAVVKWVKANPGRIADAFKGLVDRAMSASTGGLVKEVPMMSHVVDDGPYRGSHTSSAPGEGRSADNLGNVYPDDIYTDGVQYYGVGDGSAAATEMDAGAIETLKRLKGNPEGIVTIYRAVPDTINTINPGDWVTISENYAKDHAEDTGWHVISEEVRAKDIYTDGDSLHEWGYHPAIFTDTSPPTKATTSTQVETFLDRGSKRLNEVEKLEFLDDIEVEIPDIYQSAIGDFRKKKKKITTAALYSVVKAKLMGRKKYLTRQSIEKTLKWSPRAGVFHQELESLGFKWVGDNKISRSEGDFSPSFSEYYRHKDTGKTVRLSDHEPAQVRSTGRDVELHPGSFDSDKDALKALQDISTQETLESLMDSLSGDGIKLEAYESQRGGLEVIDLSLIEIPKPARKSGAGSKIMGELTDFADRHGKTIVLTPSTDFGATSVGRLVRFYKRFGFVENKGRNKNFKFRESMFREPNPAGRQ